MVNTVSAVAGIAPVVTPRATAVLLAQWGGLLSGGLHVSALPPRWSAAFSAKVLPPEAVATHYWMVTVSSSTVIVSTKSHCLGNSRTVYEPSSLSIFSWTGLVTL